MFDEEGDEDNDRYLAALNEIKCTQPLPFPTAAALGEYRDKLREGGKLRLSKVKAQPLGQYFFGKYLKEQGTVNWDEKKLLTTSLGEAIQSCTNYSNVESVVRKQTLLKDVQTLLSAARDQGATEGVVDGAVVDEALALDADDAGSLPSTALSGTQAALEAAKQAQCKQEEDNLAAFLDSPLGTEFLKYKSLETKNPGFDGFELLIPLGKGALGIVESARRVDTGAMYALKRMDKRMIKKLGNHALKMCIMERDVLRLVDSPFVVGLSYSFQTTDYLFIMMELMAGGDLQFAIDSCEVDEGIPEPQVRYHVAEIALGLMALHKNNIVYRDMKPENVLVDLGGHCRLSDMGIAYKKKGKSALKGTIGTPGYWAPEVIKGKAYGRAADWWGFGVTMYEMLSGRQPFKWARDNDPGFADAKGKAGLNKATNTWEIEYPEEFFSEHAKDLLQKLMDRDPKTRIGRDGEAIKNHPFFADIDWYLLERGMLPPPFVPDLEKVHAKAAEEIKDFVVDDMDEVELGDDVQEMFRNFAITNPDFIQKELVNLCISGKECKEAPKGRRKTKKAESGACAVQ